MRGWYRMHRGWMDHPVFRDEEFSRRDAFQWLIQEAAIQDGVVVTPEGEIVVRRGQVAHSLRHLARVWKWTDSRVRRFLKATQQSKIIDTATDAGRTVVTICNYDKYQMPAREADAPTDAAATHLRTKTDAKYKKEEKREEEEGAVSAPRPKGAYAFEGQTVRLNHADFDRWRKAYHGIADLAGELTSIDLWFQGRPENERKDWFQRTGRMLNSKHQMRVADTQAAGGGGVLLFADAALRRMERFERDERERKAQGGNE